MFHGDLLERFATDGKFLRMTALPMVEGEAEHHEGHAPEHAPPRPFVADRQPRAAEKSQRRVPADHGEHGVVVHRALAVVVLERDAIRFDADHLAAKRERHRATVGGFAFQPFELIHVFALWPVKLLLAVAQRDTRARSAQRHRRFQGRIAAADHQNVLPGEIRRIMQAVGYLVQGLARHAETPEIAAASDGDDHPARTNVRRRVVAGETDRHAVASRFYPVRTGVGDFDARVFALGL